MPYLLLLFVLMPIVEIAVLIRVGGAIGLLPTLAIVVLTAVIGTYMLRQQGSRTLARARSRLEGGEMPAAEIVEGLLLLVGGVLLLTPGFVTDAFGFACLFPLSRRWLAARLSARSIGVVVGGGFGGAGRAAGGGARREVPRGGGDTVGPGASPGADGVRAGEAESRPGPSARSPRRGGDVIEGDYRRLD